MKPCLVARGNRWTYAASLAPSGAGAGLAVFHRAATGKLRDGTMSMSMNMEVQVQVQVLGSGRGCAPRGGTRPSKRFGRDNDATARRRRGSEQGLARTWKWTCRNPRRSLRVGGDSSAGIEFRSPSSFPDSRPELG